MEAEGAAWHEKYGEMYERRHEKPPPVPEVGNGQALMVQFVTWQRDASLRVDGRVQACQRQASLCDQIVISRLGKFSFPMNSCLDGNWHV
jgi:hypothetical protein